MPSVLSIAIFAGLIPMSHFPQPFGRYILTRQIGEVGMAEIFQANVRVAEGLCKRVVIKKIRQDCALRREVTQRFVDEAKIALSLNHANIVQVFDFGQIGPTFYLAMEDVDGVDLVALMEALRCHGERMSPPLAAYIAHQVAAALAYVHLKYAHRKKDECGQALHIVHREISPHTIVVTFDGQVKILDFGVAKSTLGSLSSSRAKEEAFHGGQSPYLSPEQRRGELGDARSDIYSLGAMLYELLSGQRFGSDDEHKGNTSRTISALMPEVTADLATLVDRALVEDAQHRFATMRDMQNNLAAYLRSLPMRVDSDLLAGLVLRYRRRQSMRVLPVHESCDGSSCKEECKKEGHVDGKRFDNQQHAKLFLAALQPNLASLACTDANGEHRFWRAELQSLAVQERAQLVVHQQDFAVVHFSHDEHPHEQGEAAMRIAVALRKFCAQSPPHDSLGIMIVRAIVPTFDTNAPHSVAIPSAFAEDLRAIAVQFVDAPIMLSRRLATRMPLWRVSAPLILGASADETTPTRAWCADLKEFCAYVGHRRHDERRAVAKVGRRSV